MRTRLLVLVVLCDCRSDTGVRAPQPLALPPPVTFAPRAATERLDQKRYVVAGERAYSVGLMDGSFAPMGWHIDGEMGGVWANAIKLFDGYWFAVDGQWLPRADRFLTDVSGVTMTFPPTAGVRVTRSEVVPDGLPAVLVRLGLRSAHGRARTVTLTADVRSEILVAYPWDWSKPRSAAQSNAVDEVSLDEATGMLVFHEPNTPWHALASGHPRPQAIERVPEDWGPLTPEQRRAFSPTGTSSGGRMRWTLAVPADGEVVLWLALSGSNQGREAAQRALAAAVARPEALLLEKAQRRRGLLSLSHVALPSATLQDAFDWAKLDLDDLRRKVDAVDVRDVDEGKGFPPAALHQVSLSGIGAGFPDYTSLFGADAAYSTYALLTSGQWETARGHLKTLREVSTAINGDTGKVVHEITLEGSVYYGSNAHPGNTFETVQYAMGAALLWQWSGDERDLAESYEFVRQGLHWVTTAKDSNGNGCPEGRGIVEREGLEPETVEMVSYTWKALRGYERMARARRDDAEADWAAARATAIESQFDRRWWSPTEGLFFDSQRDCAKGIQAKQHRHWTNAVPMEVGLALPSRALKALERLESPEFSGTLGLFHTGVGGGPDGKGELKIWTVPTSVMAVAEANYGRLGEAQAQRYINGIATQLDLEMPGALPEVVSSPEYDPFSDLGKRLMFMQAWSAYGIHWPVVSHFLGVRPDVPAGVVEVIPHLPPSWPEASLRHLRVGKGTLDVHVSRGAHELRTVVDTTGGWALVLGSVLSQGVAVSGVSLDGASCRHEVVDTPRGREVRVRSVANGRHELVVRTEPIRQTRRSDP